MVVDLLDEAELYKKQKQTEEKILSSLTSFTSLVTNQTMLAELSQNFEAATVREVSNRCNKWSRNKFVILHSHLDLGKKIKIKLFI